MHANTQEAVNHMLLTSRSVSQNTTTGQTLIYYLITRVWLKADKCCTANQNEAMPNIRRETYSVGKTFVF